ncbi:MAG: SusC/RagA family TonB-linked outer membrane protein, partial [Bacteroidales bacterium]|nr:SusC/RagA family TonB-linked outer membrane protein [Bacteroidales bacterium]
MPIKKFFQYNPDDPSGIPTERTPWVAYPDNRKDFFETGFNTSNSISIEGGNEKSAARLSLSHNKSNWIMPNTQWQSFSSSLSVNHSVSKKLKITGKINYTQKDNKNLPNSGYNNHTIGYMMLFLQPNYDMAWYKAGYWVDGQENIRPKRIGDQLIENPYFIAYEILNKGKRNSVTAGASAIYTFSRKFELMVRSGMDMGNDSREQRRPFNIQRYPEGMYRQQIINNYEINTDALFTYRTLSVNNIGLTASLGGNIMQTQQQSLIAYANKLVIPGVYNLANSKDKPEITPEFLRKHINS